VAYCATRAAELAALQRRGQRHFIDDAAARGVDQHCAALHRGDAFGIEQIARRIDQRHMQADHIGSGNQRIQPDRTHTVGRVGRVAAVHHRVVGDHCHAEPARQRRGELADRAEADQAQGLARRLAAVGQRIARPLPGRHRSAAPVGAAQQQQRRGDHVLGDRQGIRAGGRDHLHAARFAAGHVDVVQADAEPPDDLAARQRGEQVAAHLGAVAHDQRIRARRLGHQPRRVVDQLRVVQHIVRGAQRRQRALVDEFADDDA